MKLSINLILSLMLSGCYYESQTGCTQYLFKKECPYIDTNTLYKEGGEAHQKYLDHKDCISKTKTVETRYKCMEDKGYKRIPLSKEYRN